MNLQDGRSGAEAALIDSSNLRCAGSFSRIIIGLMLFGIAFGYVEAAVVAYLRSIYTPIRLHFHPGIATELFPLISLTQLRTLGPEHIVRLKTELGRELATLCLLAAAATLAARNRREWVAAFLLAFGIWDITFYLFLKVLLNWPASLLTWDILFLVPVPWVGPVLAPIITSLSMIGAALVVLRREWRADPVLITGLHWLLIACGGGLILAAFMWDFRNTAAGGFPRSFQWSLFASGEVVGLLGFWHSLRRRSNSPSETLIANGD